ncbi:MAG TPA: type II toxin-antitoxin system VapC family toxin [Thermoanaerobaculia bacterium]|nr:type II toxin-antitoxin system VapC family toxin [Thermoanaerobaculia bacterium]
MRFWDSSALVALVVREPSTHAVKDLFAADSAVTAWWGTVVECESAIARLVRESALSTSAAAEARSRLEGLLTGWSEVEPSDSVRRSARRLVGLHPLRAADALQLAAAFRACDGRSEDLPFVCLDTRLSSAARAEGFPVLGASA